MRNSIWPGRAIAWNGLFLTILAILFGGCARFRAENGRVDYESRHRHDLKTGLTQTGTANDSGEVPSHIEVNPDAFALSDSEPLPSDRPDEHKKFESASQGNGKASPSIYPRSFDESHRLTPISETITHLPELEQSVDGGGGGPLKPAPAAALAALPTIRRDDSAAPTNRTNCDRNPSTPATLTPPCKSPSVLPPIQLISTAPPPAGKPESVASSSSDVLNYGHNDLSQDRGAGCEIQSCSEARTTPAVQPASDRSAAPAGDDLDLPPFADCPDDVESFVAECENSSSVELAAATGPFDSESVELAVALIPDHEDWQMQLAETIDMVAEQLSERQSADQEPDALTVNLKLLQVMIGKIDQLSQSARPLSSQEIAFWEHQTQAISAMLEAAVNTGDRSPADLSHKSVHENAIHTLTHLRGAMESLEALAELTLRHASFCTEVIGFGQLDAVHRPEFAPGAPALIYCEIENYRSEQQTVGDSTTFHTRISGGLSIVNDAGVVVQQADFPTVEDIARSRRRDFYMHLPLTIGALPTGQYRLIVRVDDEIGKKHTELDPPLEFAVSDE
jgi:hypothetical protein